MSTKLDKADENVALEAAELALRNVGRDRLAAIASGDLEDDRFSRIVAFRDRMREATLVKVAIGRHAYDYLVAQRWDDPAVEAPLQGARVGVTRCSLRAAPEALERMATECERKAKAVRDEDRLFARRLEGAAAQLTH